MRIASFTSLALWTAAALVAVLLMVLIARAYDQQVSQQLRCLPDDPNACVVTP